MCAGGTVGVPVEGELSMARSATARAVVAALAVMVLTAGLALVGPHAAALDGPARCTAVKDCIGPVTIIPAGATARFKFETSAPAKISVVASTTPDFKGPGSFGGNLNYATTHDFGLFATLQPGTTYHYKMTATDKKGRQRVETGTFKTLRRKFAVTFSQIEVIDDSDSFGAGELFFHLRAHGTILQDVYKDRSVSSGQKLYPNKTISVVGAPQAIWIYTEGRDDDCDFGQPCTGGTAPSWDSGSNSEADWATARTQIEAPGAGQADSGSFSMATTAHRLKFRVTGSWSVSYVP
jgi:hypothetical protein